MKRAFSPAKCGGILICLALLLTGQTCAPPAVNPPPPPPPPPAVTSCGLLGNNCSFGTGASPASVALADLDHDHDLDLAVVNLGLDSVTLLANDGTGNFIKGVSLAAGDAPNSIFADDFDNDGDTDLAITSDFNGTGPAVVMFKNNGTGTFGSATAFAVGGVPAFVTGADLDYDGDTDLVTANSVTDTITILFNDGDAGFDVTADFQVGREPVSIAIADLDFDGDLDLAVANRSDDTVSILRKKEGQFMTPINFAAGIHPQSVVAGRFDADDDIDLAVANEGPDGDSNDTDTVSLVPNNGDATFDAAQQFPVGVNPRFLATGDFDGDGDLDLAAANFGTGPDTSNVTILLNNNGFGILGPNSPFQAGNGPLWIAVGDVDGDHIPDLAIAHFNAGGVQVFGNDGDAAFTRGN